MCLFLSYDLNEMNDYQTKINTTDSNINKNESNSDHVCNTADKSESDMKIEQNQSIGSHQQSNLKTEQKSKEDIYKLQQNLKNIIMDIINEIHLVKTMFQVEQIKCKYQYWVRALGGT